MTASASELGPLDVVAALGREMLTFDQLQGLLKADRIATEQALRAAIRRMWVVHPIQTPSAGYAPENQLPYLHATSEGLDALQEARACGG